MTNMRPNGMDYKIFLQRCKIKRHDALTIYKSTDCSYAHLARIFGCSKSYVQIMIWQATKERKEWGIN